MGLQLSEQPGTCDDWNDRWLANIDAFHPNVVVLLTGAWDLLDRKIDGTWYTPGDVAFDRYFLSELDQATQLLGSRGARVVILTTPFLYRPELVGQTGHDWPEYDPWRVDRINALYRDFLVAHPGRYTLIDLNKYVSPGGKYTDSLGGVQIRDDGVHFTADGAAYVARWLAPQLEALAQLPATPATSDVEHFDPRHLRRDLTGCASPSSGTPASTSRRVRARSSSIRGSSARATGGRGGTTRPHPRPNPSGWPPTTCTSRTITSITSTTRRCGGSIAGAHVLVPRFGVDVIAGEVRGLGFGEVMELPHAQVVQFGPGRAGRVVPVRHRRHGVRRSPTATTCSSTSTTARSGAVRSGSSATSSGDRRSSSRATRSRRATPRATRPTTLPISS